MPSAIDLFTKLPDGSFKPKVDTGLMALFVGRTGSGKSAAEVSFPGKTYTFDIDGRIRGAAGASNWLGLDHLKNLDYDTISYKEGFTFIDSKCEKFLTQGRNCEYQNFCFDSIGSLIFMLLLDSQAIRTGKKEDSGKIRGSVRFLHPDDYNYVSTAFRHIIFKFAVPMIKLGKNVFFSGWIVDKWGRGAGSNEYAPQTIVGEQLLGPNKLCEEIPGYFDEIYYFRRRENSMGNIQFEAEFRGEFARTIYSALPRLADITNKSFHSVLKEYLDVKSSS